MQTFDTPAPQLPAETVQQILHEFGDDAKASSAAAGISKFWALQQRASCFKEELLFSGEKDIIAFERIIATPICTFPLPIQCEHLSFLSLPSITSQGAAAIDAVLPHISPPRSLKIGVLKNGIPRALYKALPTMGGKLYTLTISGGVHDPQTFFPFLSSLPNLTTLIFQDFKFQTVKTWWGRRPTYAFPLVLKTLAVIGDVSSFDFFLDQVLPGAGFSNIDTLSVHTRFCFDDAGVSAMLACFRSVATIGTIILRPTYDAACRNLSRNMSSIFSSPQHPLLRLPGVNSLKVDFSDSPAEWALNCLSICALYLPSRDNALTIDICLPRSLELWDEKDPAAQFANMLEQVDYDNPLARGPQKSTLIMRDFPVPLPGRFEAAPTVCGFSVVIVDAAA